MSGKIVHFEIPFDDGVRARGFYREAFGWQLTEMPEMSYTIVATGPSGDDGFPAEPGFINGGMTSRRQVPMRGPTVVVEVDDIEATLKTVGALGGHTTVGRTAVADMGFSAYITDPEGNLIGLWETRG